MRPDVRKSRAQRLTKQQHRRPEETLPEDQIHAEDSESLVQGSLSQDSALGHSNVDSNSKQDETTDGSTNDNGELSDVQLKDSKHTVNGLIGSQRKIRLTDASSIASDSSASTTKPRTSGRRSMLTARAKSSVTYLKRPRLATKSSLTSTQDTRSTASSEEIDDPAPGLIIQGQMNGHTNGNGHVEDDLHSISDQDQRPPLKRARHTHSKDDIEHGIDTPLRSSNGFTSTTPPPPSIEHEEQQVGDDNRTAIHSIISRRSSISSTLSSDLSDIGSISSSSAESTSSKDSVSTTGSNLVRLLNEFTAAKLSALEYQNGDGDHEIDHALQDQDDALTAQALALLSRWRARWLQMDKVVKANARRSERRKEDREAKANSGKWRSKH